MSWARLSCWCSSCCSCSFSFCSLSISLCELSSKQLQSLGKSARKTYAWVAATGGQTKKQPKHGQYGRRCTTTGVNTNTHTATHTHTHRDRLTARPLWAAISHVINRARRVCVCVCVSHRATMRAKTVQTLAEWAQKEAREQEQEEE